MKLGPKQLRRWVYRRSFPDMQATESAGPSGPEGGEAGEEGGAGKQGAAANAAQPETNMQWSRSFIEGI